MVGSFGCGASRGGIRMHPNTRIDTVYLCRYSVGFRKQINGLAAIVEQELALPLFGGALPAPAKMHKDRSYSDKAVESDFEMS